MGYRIENKSIDASEIKRLSKIASGKTGDLYRYRNDALKIFRENGETPIEEKTARYLQDITTDRILLPRKLLFYNAAFRGYTLKLVTRKGSAKRLINMDKPQLLSGLGMIEDDVETLSRKRILLNGVSPENVVFNGNVYLSDPSKFTIFDISDTQELEKINKYQIQLLLIELIASELNRQNYTQKQIKNFKEILSLRDNDESLCTFLNHIMDGEETIKQLVKKMGI